MKKRLLSALLVLCMVLTILPGTAWADFVLVDGAIQGQVYGAASGTLEPVGETVNVAVYAQSDLNTALATCTTDSEGVFTLTRDGGFPAGNYTVVLTSSLYLTEKREITISSGNSGYTFARIDLTVLGKVYGTVTDANAGTALSGVNVEAYRDSALIGSTTTDASGAYSLEGERGPCQLVFTKDGYDSKTIDTNLSGPLSWELLDVRMTSTFGEIPEIVASGSCGASYFDNITWTLDSNGVLTITGTGTMDDYNYYGSLRSPSPWTSMNQNITSIIINNGVTNIGHDAFWGCSKVTNITIPNSVTSIGSGAFLNCTGLVSVIIPSSVKLIYREAFWDKNISDIYYSGSQAQWKAIKDYGGNYGLYSATIHYNSTGPDEGDKPTGEITLQLDSDTVSVGDTVYISASFLHDGSFQERDVTWSSSDDGIATVTPTGTMINDASASAIAEIEGISEGSATITVLLTDGRSAGVIVDVNRNTEPSGEFQISANTATTCLKKGTTFEMDVAYYKNGEIDYGVKEFIAVSSDSNVLDFTTGGWNDKTGRRYTVTAKEAGSCSITFTNPSDGKANRIDFTVVDGETGYTFDGVPQMTIEKGKTTNFYNFSGMVVDDFAYTPHKDADGNIDYYVVTMTVYNKKNLYAAAASYQADGEIYEFAIIDKHSDYSTSFVGDLKDLTNSIGDLFYSKRH